MRIRPVWYVMLAALFATGVGIYAFYAMQPLLLELYGDPKAYTIAGLAAALVAGAQIAGGYAAPKIRRLFRKRTTALILGIVAGSVVLALLGIVDAFWLALGLLVLWGLIFAAETPIRRAYLNDMIPSKQRATLLSFDCHGQRGRVVIQPFLGRSADISGTGVAALRRGHPARLGAVSLFSRRQNAPADTASGNPSTIPAT